MLGCRPAHIPNMLHHFVIPRLLVASLMPLSSLAKLFLALRLPQVGHVGDGSLSPNRLDAVSPCGEYQWHIPQNAFSMEPERRSSPNPLPVCRAPLRWLPVCRPEGGPGTRPSGSQLGSHLDTLTLT